MAITEGNYLTSTSPELIFDEAQKMLEIHTSTMMHVSIDFTNIVKVPVRWGEEAAVAQFESAQRERKRLTTRQG